jgi:hypothetical protein
VSPWLGPKPVLAFMAGVVVGQLITIALYTSLAPSKPRCLEPEGETPIPEKVLH